MQDMLETMDRLTGELQRLEAQMLGQDFEGRNALELLGANPQAGYSKLVEFKAAVDRLRAFTWVYMEAAAKAGNFPSQKIPIALREFLNEQATRTRGASAAPAAKQG